MLAFISCAKTMASRSTLQVPQMTNPRFTDEALGLRMRRCAMR